MQPELLTHNGLRLIAHLMQARYGLILDAPDDAGGLELLDAVDTEGKRVLSGPPLRGKALPEITSTLVRGRAKVLRKEQELRATQDALGLAPTGEAMIAPVKLESERLCGMMLFANRDRPNWSAADLQTLEAWAAYLGRKINSTSDTMEGTRSEDVEILRGELRLALEELAEVSALESGNSISQVGTLTSMLKEMREPVRSLQSHSQMLLNDASGERDSDQLELLDSIEEDVDRLDQQLRALLNLVSVPPGTIRFEAAIASVLEIAEKQVATDLNETGIRLRRELPESLPRVAADADQLRQAVVILFERAIQISPSGSELRVTAQADDQGWVSITISDQGPGVPAEDLGRVFHASEGALPQVKTLVDSMGGRVWIGSEMGAGSTVTVLIPASEGTVASAS
ncbi:MAG: sensor histidine kinase [Anaerolineales bacterium]